MRKPTLKLLCTAPLAALLALAPLAATAQPYPTKGPIRMVVGFAPGGGADTIARAINTRMGEILKQSVVVENRSGAGGAISTEHVAKSAPDGYTISFTLNNHTINQALYAKLPFDTERDLRGVVLIGALAQLLAAHPSAPASTLQEFLQQAKGNDPRARTYASGGVGSPGHFAMAYLESLSGLDFVHIPYKGAGPAMADVLGNQVPYILSTLAGLIPHVKAGKLKAIALTSKERLPSLPNVPTIAEGGFPGYDMDTWIGLFVPRATPDAIVKTLHDATLEALKSQSVRDRFEAVAGRIAPGSGAELDALVANDIRQLTKVVKERGIKPE